MKHVVVGIIAQHNQQGEDEYLLVSSEKESFGEHFGSYYPPGGHIEEDEDEKQALIREIKEKVNLKVVPTKKIAETLSDVEGQTTHWW